MHHHDRNWSGTRTLVDYQLKRLLIVKTLGSTLKLPGPNVGMGGSLTVTVA